MTAATLDTSAAPRPQSAERLLTAEEYLNLPPDGRRTELVRGRVVDVSKPGFRHGFIALWVGHLLLSMYERGIGRPVVESGMLTERDPDTVRGPDVHFYSFDRMPADQEPEGFPSVSPEVVFEVRSPNDRQTDILRKVTEYLDADVLCVVVLSPIRRTAVLYFPDAEPTFLREHDRLSLPSPLSDWTPSVGELLTPRPPAASAN
ncbi:MAG: Uma2 family endonuclease [Planctomycetota bacterium]